MQTKKTLLLIMLCMAVFVANDQSYIV